MFTYHQSLHTEGPLSPTTPTPGNEQRGKTRLISCTLCQQRKVKCDKTRPACSNCVRYRVSCIYVAPALPLRKKRKSPEEELLGRLKRYERLLEAHGIQADKDLDHTSTPLGNNAVLEASKTGVVNERVPSPKDTDGIDQNPFKPSGNFVVAAGKPNFIESPLWNVLSEELQGPVDLRRLSQSNGKDNHKSSGATSDIFLNAGDFLLSSAATHSDAELKAMHPKPLVIFRLWQVFLDNINPLTKLIHAPTTQQRLLDASANLEKISKEWEALMFAIYLSAIQSMSTDDCQMILGESKGVLIQRYHPAVRSALVRANFTSSVDILLVQAFALYLLSVRQYYEPNSLWVLTGTAVRLGQRIGLHRDGTLVGLSPFETEVRRRVWWRLLALDGQTADLCGAGLSVAFPAYDCKRPLNINDSDLSPNMSALPPEHDGPTEMIFCGFRYEIALFLRSVKASSSWMETGLNERAVEERKNQLDELQALIERKYLRFCDPSVPLHLFARLMGEATIMALRLVAPYPRRYPQGLIEMHPKERDEVFWISMDVLGFYNLSQRTESIRRYLWNVNVQFQWHAFIILAHELQLRPEDKHTRNAWSKIEELFQYNADVIVNTSSPLHKAVSNLILKAWAARQNRLQRSNTQLHIPAFIATLQAQAAKQNVKTQTKVSYTPSETPATESTPTAQSNGTEPPTGTNGGFLEALPPNVLADGTPIDWSEWDYLLQDFELQNASFAQT